MSSAAAAGGSPIYDGRSLATCSADLLKGIGRRWIGGHVTKVLGWDRRMPEWLTDLAEPLLFFLRGAGILGEDHGTLRARGEGGALLQRAPEVLGGRLLEGYLRLEGWQERPFPSWEVRPASLAAGRRLLVEALSE